MSDQHLHLLLATQETLTDERFQALQKVPGIRALNRATVGSRQTLVYVSGTTTQTRSGTLQGCPEGIPGCTDYLVSPLGAIGPCRVPERFLNLHVLLEVSNRRAFADVVLGTQERYSNGETLDIAAGYLFGPAGANVIVEITADSQEELLEPLLDVVDHELVVTSDVHVMTRGDVFRRDAVDE